MTQLDAQLGVGVHPMDASTDMGSYAGESPANASPQASSGTTRDTPWNTPNDEAFAVYERAAHDWSANTLVIRQTTKILGRQKGRKLVTLWVPSGAAAGVVLAPTQGEADMGNGVTLIPGATVDLATEAGIYAGLIAGQATGTIAYVALVNPLGS